jgi:hypothetical protein
MKIPGVAEEYEISENGAVRFLGTTKTHSDGTVRTYKPGIRKPTKRKDGYWQIRLPTQTRKVKNHLLHRLVALAFLPNPKNKREVNHDDNNPDNNNVANLIWATTKENINHAHKNGYVNSVRGEKHPCTQLNEKLVREIRKLAGASNMREIRHFLKANYGISITEVAIGCIVRRKTWKHVL